MRPTVEERARIHKVVQNVQIKNGGKAFQNLHVIASRGRFFIFLPV